MRPLPIPPRALVVSCQARADNPLHGAAFMAAMARASVQGGAAGIRANGTADVAAIRSAVDVPVIGILKRWDAGWPVYITPDFGSAAAIAAAGAHVVALDATPRPRNGESLDVLIPRIRTKLGIPVMADVATLEDGLHAAALGADCVATTLSGYTEETKHRAARGPDLELVGALAEALNIPVIAEGRFSHPDQVTAALQRGAHAVVVGTAITNPREITRGFVAATRP